MSDILAILVSERDKLNRAIEALGGEPDNSTVRPPQFKEPKPQANVKRTVSPEIRTRIAEAQKARWGQIKAAPAFKKVPGALSAEAKAKISRAMKARWAERKGNA